MRKRKKTAEYDIGSTGATKIARDLAQHGPQKMVPIIQERNGLKVGEYDPMLAFLDVFGVRRGGVYKSMMEKLRERLLQYLPHMDDEQKRKLFTKALGYADVQELRPIIHKILPYFNNVIPEELLPKLSKKLKDKDMYLPDNAKHQIWESNSQLGIRQLSVLCDKYLQHHAKRNSMHGKLKDSSRENIATENASDMGRNPLTEIVKAGQASWKLYQLILQITRGGFVSKELQGYCRLRLDLVHQSAHLSKVHSLLKVIIIHICDFERLI